MYKDLTDEELEFEIVALEMTISGIKLAGCDYSDERKCLDRALEELQRRKKA